MLVPRLLIAMALLALLPACSDDAPVAPAALPTVDVVSPVRATSSGGWSAVTAGAVHACALSRSGEAFCWGDNHFGQLGNPAVDAAHDFRAEAPIAVATDARFVEIQTSGLATCARTRNGDVHCWGANSFGQLGAASTDDCDGTPCSFLPSPVDGGIRFASLDGGWRYFCGLSQGGDAYCWGWNNRGQLGFVSGESCEGSPCTTAPSQVPMGVRLAQISAGFWHTCGVTRGGEAWCWGLNIGTFGNGTDDFAGFEPPQPAVPGFRLAEIRSGAVYTCALDRQGRAFCFGSFNLTGEFGNGTVEDTAVPVPVSGDHRFASLAIHNENSVLGRTCGTARDGATWCWGENGRGGLGTPGGDTCEFGGVPFDCALTPVQVSGGLRVDDLAMGLGFSCATTRSGEAWCWGSNTFGQLGATTVETCPWFDNDEPCSTVPVRVDPPFSPAAVAAAPLASTPTRSSEPPAFDVPPAVSLLERVGPAR